jgi:hypothetical protein
MFPKLMFQIEKKTQRRKQRKNETHQPAKSRLKSKAVLKKKRVGTLITFPIKKILF